MTPAADESAADWHARMMFYGKEDPATGSAAGPAIAWLVRHGRAASEERIVLEQGIEMNRPSRLYLSAKLVGDKVSEVFVGGRTIPVATGRFFLP
jgi:trans-2,3-dihydro-3-hydroxyanthranilate isomerase